MVVIEPSVSWLSEETDDDPSPAEWSAGSGDILGTGLPFESYSRTLKSNAPSIVAAIQRFWNKLENKLELDVTKDT